MTPPGAAQGAMPRAFSVYLDLVRFTAACLVYLYHSNQRWLVADVLPASTYGHSAVVVFFVLSGYVIAFITDTKERAWTTYAASRIARIYSVALPAVLLTVALDGVGRWLYPPAYGYPFDHIGVRTLASLLLVNEWWFVSITSFSNVPYWSICFESWYYVLFGIAVFAPARLAPWIVAVLLLLLGPKVALLAPIWIAGVVLYRWQALARMGMGAAAVLAGASAVGIVAFHHLQVAAAASTWLKGLIGAEWTRQLTFSQYFLSDYLLGLMVFFHFAGMRRAATLADGLLRRVETPIRVLAGSTLTLYLLHQPLFLFWGAVLRGSPQGMASWWTVTALVFASVLAISHFTESRRGTLKGWVLRWLRRGEAFWRARRHAIGA